MNRIGHVADIQARVITEVEEQALLRYFGRRLIDVCAKLRLSRNVLASSMVYLRRFYVHCSIFEYDPQRIALTALYVACKCCDSYLSAAELGRLMGVPHEILLRSELALLQGLNFDLVIHSGYRGFDGCIQDSFFEEMSSEQLSRVKDKGYKILDALYLSDAPLAFTPGQLGLSALQEGLKSVGMEEKGLEFTSHIASMANKSVSSLRNTLELARTMAFDVQALDTIDVAEVDRRLKEFQKNILASSGSKRSKKNNAQ